MPLTFSNTSKPGGRPAVRKDNSRSFSRRGQAAAWTLLTLFSFSHALLGAELIPDGPESKAAAGAGQTISRGSVAVMYNPANVIRTSKVEPMVEVGIASVSYAFLHDDPKYQLVNLDVTAPPVGAGISGRAGRFAGGLFFAPTGTGEARTIENVPVDVSGVGTTLMKVETADSGYRLGIGAAVMLHKRFTVGVGVIRYQETQETRTYGATSTTPSVEALSSGAFHHLTAGARFALAQDLFVLGASFRPAAEKAYESQITAAGKTVDKQRIGYLPMTFGLGLEVRAAKFGIFGEYVREGFRPGGEIVKKGFNDQSTTDLVNANNVAGGIRIFVNKVQTLTLAAGYYPTNLGTGYYAAEGAPENEQITGPQFGDLNAISRITFAGGYRFKAGRVDLHATGYYSYGNRSVEPGVPGQGRYTLDVFVGNLGVAVPF